MKYVILNVEIRKTKYAELEAYILEADVSINFFWKGRKQKE